MVEKSENTPGRGGANVDLADLHRAIAQGLCAASASLACGEIQEAERAAKAVSALVKAARDAAEVAAMAQTDSPEEDVEELRAELRRRIALYVEADLADAPPEVLERIALEGRTG